MSQSLTRVVIHLTYSTKHRAHFLKDENIRRRLESYSGGILRDTECPPIRIRSVSDHIHLLFGLGKKIAIADAVKEVKTGTSEWLKEVDDSLLRFYWQGGYAAFSVSEDRVPEVARYIDRQDEHHKAVSFQDELRALLRAHGVEFDERYLWD